MPYYSISDLPEGVKRVLPTKALVEYMTGFNYAWQNGLSDQRCAMYAWGKIKGMGYHKNPATGLWFKPKKPVRSRR